MMADGLILQSEPTGLGCFSPALSWNGNAVVA